MEPGPREPAPTVEEVEKALKYTRDGKAAGPDDITIELLKLGGDSVVKAMYKIIVCVGLWNTGILANGQRTRLNPPLCHYTKKVTKQYVLTIVRYLWYRTPVKYY